jgi:hypothetical protein
MINVYITNLAKYNEGKLVGQWVSLPLPLDELEKIINEILGNDEEYFISDYECDFMTIDEYSDIYELNELVERIDDLNEYDQKKVKAILEWGACKNVEEAINNLDDFIFYEDVTNEKELAEHFLDEIGFDLPQVIEANIDYEGLGQDLATGFFSSYGYIEEY